MFRTVQRCVPSTKLICKNLLIRHCDLKPNLLSRRSDLYRNLFIRTFAQKPAKMAVQNFDAFFVLDFEATCLRDQPIEPQVIL